MTDSEDVPVNMIKLPKLTVTFCHFLFILSKAFLDKIGYNNYRYEKVFGISLFAKCFRIHQIFAPAALCDRSAGMKNAYRQRTETGKIIR
ncbi:MAG TPA: hypothetical protein DCR16_00710 [Lachnospiraceae bacterium]|nr:hypothetical protein [Lachnospiraceae bacterium]